MYVNIILLLLHIHILYICIFTPIRRGSFSREGRKAGNRRWEQVFHEPLEVEQRGGCLNMLYVLRHGTLTADEPTKITCIYIHTYIYIYMYTHICIQRVACLNVRSRVDILICDSVGNGICICIVSFLCVHTRMKCMDMYLLYLCIHA